VRAHARISSARTGEGGGSGGGGGGSGGGLGGGGEGGGEHACGVLSVNVPPPPFQHCVFTTSEVVLLHASETLYSQLPLPTYLRCAGSEL
jgi:hypothetical protein